MEKIVVFLEVKTSSLLDGSTIDSISTEQQMTMVS